MYFFETWSYPVAKASLKFVKIYNSGWPELVISLFHPLKYWDSRHGHHACINIFFIQYGINEYSV